MMTIKELISVLQTFPMDLPVATDGGLLEKENIRIYKDYYNGDCANPNCEIIENVIYIE